MADTEVLKILKGSVEEWNRWRAAHPSVRPNLSEADLSEAKLSEAKLSGAYLSGANLSGANLSKALRTDDGGREPAPQPKL